MSLTEEEVAQLLVKKIAGQLTPEEEKLLHEWIDASAANKALFGQLSNLTVLKGKLAQYSALSNEGQWPAPMATKDDNRQPTDTKQGRPIHVLKTEWFRYAAVVSVLFAMGAYIWLKSKNNQPGVAGVQPVSMQNDKAPGHDGAVLTLADGSKIVLDSIGNGIVANQNGVRVVLKNGQLSYDPVAKLSGDMVYNIMTTPNGRQFQLQLPDGTKAWLNSASAIRYPTVFVGDERKVEITGEVYFEVAKNGKMPFRVNVKNQAEIKVLGTHFNVKAYQDESSIRTTLLEGSVRISAYKQLQMLKPGQQAQVNVNKQIKVVNDADVNQVMAWKNGLFDFNGYDVKSVMRELARWYDLEIVYESEPEPEEIVGEMQRNLTFSQVMIALKKLGINYRLEGEKLIISK